jgi:hypothetical protein
MGSIMKKLWELPVPSTALLLSPKFEKGLGRTVALRLSYEGDDDQPRNPAVVFEDVEAFKCTYYTAFDAFALEAYDRLVDRGETAWLSEIRANLQRNGGNSHGLVHMMITFDDGPSFEVVCRSFRVEQQ